MSDERRKVQPHAAETGGPVRRTAAPMIVGSADDFAERDADRVADEVLSRLGNTPHVHDDGCHGSAVRRSSTATAGAEVGYEGGEISGGLSRRIDAARSGGSALDEPVRQRMEAGFGQSLGDVRVHTGGEAATLARSVSARAFTTGRDIFFGAGEYAPGTPEGERVLAHEIAHTRQQSGAARRLHRWALEDRTIAWNKTRTISTIDSGQAIYVLDDGTGKIVVKTEDSPIGLGKLSEVVLDNLSGAKSVKHRKLSAKDRQAVVPLITAPDAGLLDRASWAKLGRNKRTEGWLIESLEQQAGKPKGSGIDDVDDVEVGRHFHDVYLHTAMGNTPMMAMSFADGVRAQEASTTRNMRNPMDTSGTDMMRGLLTDFKHMQGLGKLTAIDLFLGNGDRVMSGNVGNWFYDPWSAAITVIDHVDQTVPLTFRRDSQDKTAMAALLKSLSSGQLGKTATEAIKSMCVGVADKGKDSGIAAWMDAEGGYRRQIAEEALERGLVEGRQTLIKTFGATRFSVSKSGRNARSAKKAIKSASSKAAAMDTSDDNYIGPDDYYKILKARAQWLKKN